MVKLHYEMASGSGYNPSGTVPGPASPSSVSASASSRSTSNLPRVLNAFFVVEKLKFNHSVELGTILMRQGRRAAAGAAEPRGADCARWLCHYRMVPGTSRVVIFQKHVF